MSQALIQVQVYLSVNLCVNWFLKSFCSFCFVTCVVLRAVEVEIYNLHYINVQKLWLLKHFLLLFKWLRNFLVFLARPSIFDTDLMPSTSFEELINNLFC